MIPEQAHSASAAVHLPDRKIQNKKGETKKMHELNLEILEKVAGGKISKAKEIYKYLSDEDKKKLKELEEEISKR
jgi:hypothetical protein